MLEEVPAASQRSSVARIGSAAEAAVSAWRQVAAKRAIVVAAIEVVRSQFMASLLVGVLLNQYRMLRMSYRSVGSRTSKYRAFGRSG